MRQITAFTLFVAAIMAVSLFFLKYEVTNLESELEGLNKKIVADHEAIHVLKAEWGHLNDVERVRELSARFLDLAPTSGARIVTLDELPTAVEPQVAAQTQVPAKKTVTR
jgi:hypothetical protein